MFSGSVGVWAGAYGSCADSGVVYSVFVFVVVFVGPVSFLFLACFFAAFWAAVYLSVMVFGVGFSADWAFCFGVFDLDFHSSPIWFRIFVAVLSAIPSIFIRSLCVSLNKSAIVFRL